MNKENTNKKTQTKVYGVKTPEIDTNVQLTLFGYPISMSELEKLRSNEWDYKITCEIFDVVSNE